MRIIVPIIKLKAEQAKSDRNFGFPERIAKLEHIYRILMDKMKQN